MKKSKLFTLLAILAFSTGGFSGCADNSGGDNPSPQAEPGTVGQPAESILAAA